MLKSFLVLQKFCCLLTLFNCALFLPLVSVAEAAEVQISIMHYFTGDLGKLEFEKTFDRFSREQNIQIVNKPVGHEDFKNAILQIAAEGRMPDVTSYWAGARTQFLVDGGALAPLSDLWTRGQYAKLIPESLSAASSLYNGERYLIPFGYHAVGFFYNPKVFKKVGVTNLPKTWSEFLQLCDQLKKAGIKPLALGAKNRWPAQFWFDYLLLRTAGPEFRKNLMSGAASYLDPQVLAAMQYWTELLKKGYFRRGVLTDDWTDAADQVSSGQAAMTLMGSWITGYWKGKQLVPEEEFDFFPFPEIDPAQPRVVVGPVDGFVVGANSMNKGQAANLIDFLLTDLTVQQGWVTAQGALSPNRLVPASIYDPVMKKVLREVERAEHFVFNYDLSTSPPVAELGLSMFRRFLQMNGNIAEELNEIAGMAGILLGSDASSHDKY